MNTNEKSECCNADVSIGGISDFENDDKICTRYYVCENCKQACSLK